MGDVSGDGKADMVVANHSGSSVSVLLGDGNGSFEVTTNLTVGMSRPRSLVLADFDGDGRADLGVANEGSSRVSVWLSRSDGSWQVQGSYAVGAAPYSMAVGDVSGDGWLDLVTANYNGNNVSVLLGDGEGGVGVGANVAVETSLRSVAVGNLDGDSWPDLVVVSRANQVSVLLGTGGGSFAAPVSYATGGSGPYQVVLAGLGGDGALDVLVGNNGGSVSVLRGHGDGTLGGAYNHGNLRYVRSLAVGDWNGDGRMDLAAVNTDGDAINILLGNREQWLVEDPAGSGLRSGYGRGSLKDTGDYDYWSFSGQAGELLTVALETVGSVYQSSLYCWVGRSDGTAVREFTTDTHGFGQCSPVELPVAGTYTVYVRYNHDYRGEYRLRVSLARPPLQMESEANNTIAQANQPGFMLTNGQDVASIAGYVSVGDTSGDYYWLRNRAVGTKITLDLSQPLSSGLVGQLWIYNAAGTLMTNAPAGVSNLVYDVLSGTDYYARVTAGSGAGLLSQYLLSVTVTDTVSPVIAGLSVGNGYGSEVVTDGGVLNVMADRFRLDFSEDLLPGSVNDAALRGIAESRTIPEYRRSSTGHEPLPGRPPLRETPVDPHHTAASTQRQDSEDSNWLQQLWPGGDGLRHLQLYDGRGSRGDTGLPVERFRRPYLFGRFRAGFRDSKQSGIDRAEFTAYRSLGAAVMNLAVIRRAVVSLAIAWCRRQTNRRLATMSGFFDFMSGKNSQRAFKILNPSKHVRLSNL